MFMMAIPMQILFEISLIIARMWSRKAAEESAG
jgi:Sec-independent protein secretion pathway component TatC